MRKRPIQAHHPANDKIAIHGLEGRFLFASNPAIPSCLQLLGVPVFADQQFPGAVQIVDLFHARQHLWDIARALHPLDQTAQQRWILRHQPKLDSGQIEKLTAYLDSRLAGATPAQQEILRVETAYFDKNKDRMRYPEFRAQGLFIGSGVIEAGCKTLIGARLKQSGMFWSVEGANAIIALRCCQMNNRFQDYWDQRRVA